MGYSCQNGLIIRFDPNIILNELFNNGLCVSCRVTHFIIGSCLNMYFQHDYYSCRVRIDKYWRIPVV